MTQNDYTQEILDIIQRAYADDETDAALYDEEIIADIETVWCSMPEAMKGKLWIVRSSLDLWKEDENLTDYDIMMEVREQLQFGRSYINADLIPF